MKSMRLLALSGLAALLLVWTMGPLPSQMRLGGQAGSAALALQTCPQLNPDNYTLHPNPDGSPGWNHVSYCGKALTVPQALNNVEPNVTFVFHFVGSATGWTWWIKGAPGNTLTDLASEMILWAYFSGPAGTVWNQPAP